MLKNNYKNVILKALLIFSLGLLCFILFPLSAQAFDAGSLYENKPVESGDPSYYIDTLNNNCWVVSEAHWHECVYDNSNYEQITADIRQAMYGREDQYYTYFFVDKKADADDINTIFNIVNEQVYADDKTPYGGDYLEFMSRLYINENSGILSVSSSCSEYNFYRLTVDIDNMTTKTEEDMITEYLEYFNKIYIQEDEKISNATGDEKQYYIVKTIYNFLAKNTVYDMDVYKGVYESDTARYRYSHTAYGTLFGNTEGAYNPESFDFYKSINLSYQVDSQGLRRIYTRSQGRSVCDGYSLVFYYLCKLNGIDCRIVKGDNVGSLESDPHAWNMVYLKDYDDEDYVWYAVDATFGCQKSKKISDVFTIVDYSYFLRGSENESFSADNHQQLYEEYKSINQSSTDYEFEISDVLEENLYTIVTRRRDEDADKEFIDTGEYNLENYLIIAPDGKCYKLDGDNENNYFLSDGFTFYSTGYYYKCEFYDFARGVEYTCEDRFIRDAGTYEFDIVTIQNNVVYKKYVEISQLDMGDWANYDMDLTQYTESAYFSGSEIAISAEIYDNSKAKLTAGKDYELNCYLNSDASKACITPHDPGDYTIRITYLGNYSGYIEVPFSVLKTDLSKLILPDSCSVTYSADIAKSCASLKIGDTTILSGTDYRVDVVGGLNYGDTGSVIITGLADSKYVQEGSVAQWTYVVDKQYDISSLFNNAYITNAKYLYTGSEIKPTDFTLSYIKSSTGQTIKLVRGTDYVIASYSDNINAGTGKVIINFIGNYTGTATMKFYIEYGQVTITCADLTYNGKSQTANPVVKVGSAVLKKGTDYTVSGSATNPGLYTGKIAGKGNFSALSGTFVYYIKPATLSGVKTTTATNSITVSWTKQGSNCIYEVWVYDTGINGWKLVCSTSGSSYKITAVYVNGKKTVVKANTQYKIRVRAVIKGTVNGTAVVKYGAVKEITERTNPAALSGVKHSSTVNSVTVSWTKQSGCTYQVWVYDTGIKGWKLVGSTSNASYKITSVYVNGKKTAVKANTQYKIRVRAVYSGTLNGVKVTKNGTVTELTERTNPAALSGVKHSSTVNSVTVSWTKQSGCTYQVWVYDTGIKGWKLVGSTSNASYKITSVYVNGKKTAVKANTQYKIRVRAVYSGTLNGVKVTKNGTVKELTERTNPNTLSGVKSSVARNSITVSWTKQSGCTYQVWVYDTGSKGWKLVGSTSGASYKITSVYVNGKKTAVKANTQYKIRVRAVYSGTLNGAKVTKYGAVKQLTVRTKK